LGLGEASACSFSSAALAAVQLGILHKETLLELATKAAVVVVGHAVSVAAAPVLAQQLTTRPCIRCNLGLMPYNTNYLLLYATCCIICSADARGV
jgi:hypothetical protein